MLPVSITPKFCSSTPNPDSLLNQASKHRRLHQGNRISTTWCNTGHLHTEEGSYYLDPIVSERKELNMTASPASDFLSAPTAASPSPYTDFDKQYLAGTWRLGGSDRVQQDTNPYNGD